MKKTLAISLMIIAAFSMVNYGAFFVKTAAASMEPNIQDPMLLEAWVRLYNHQEPIQLWDGSTLTGRELAQYLLAHAIPVVWDTGNICKNASCSIRYCTPDACGYEDGKPGVDPIYILPTKSADMQSLIGTLAHEIFHRTQPFGAVEDTRFEEYWAFLIGAKISKAVWLKFGAYDPLDPGHLNLWIKDNGLDAYFELQEYPATVVPMTQSAYIGSDQFNGIPAAAFGISQNSPDETK